MSDRCPICKEFGHSSLACPSVDRRLAPLPDAGLRDNVWAELLACYGEGENTDWPWFKDLVDVVVELVGKYGSLAVYVEVATEHRKAVEAARKVVATMYPPSFDSALRMAAALVAIDEAMRDRSEMTAEELEAEGVVVLPRKPHGP